MNILATISSLQIPPVDISDHRRHVFHETDLASPAAELEFTGVDAMVFVAAIARTQMKRNAKAGVFLGDSEF
ncbi:hypothetical protein FH972_002009 [Carpinus fangiana]|uniref:Uncharacterized protein n=1 Tax=Carpinus fangiana TaxID=176857 RepID=A0A5N6QDJ1_9ROSI|nr:hypothetical protein FH972_002009 [Carpinus fangiana]